MKNIAAALLTGGLTILAALLLYGEYREYTDRPWTRDGLVQADILLITPRVSAPVTAVHVQNNQAVRAGELLFELDAAPFVLALEKAQGAMETARREQQRPATAAHGQSALPRENLSGAEAARRQALCEAALRLSWTKIYAPADGYVANMTLRPGVMALENQPVFALVDTASFRVTGFFRETLLRRIRPGAAARVTLMAYPETELQGTVESIDWGIAQRNGSTGENMLPSVSPTFDWIRLAQRVPVNIRLRQVPKDVLLRVGITASVQILP